MTPAELRVVEALCEVSGKAYDDIELPCVLDHINGALTTLVIMNVNRKPGKTVYWEAIKGTCMVRCPDCKNAIHAEDALTTAKCCYCGSVMIE